MSVRGGREQTEVQAVVNDHANEIAMVIVIDDVIEISIVMMMMRMTMIVDVVSIESVIVTDYVIDVGGVCMSEVNVTDCHYELSLTMMMMLLLQLMMTMMTMSRSSTLS